MPRRSPRPYTYSGTASRLRTIACTTVPVVTRIIGPGVCNGPPGSANAATVRRRPSGPSGIHTPVRASRISVRSPWTTRPAGVRLSLGSTAGRSSLVARARGAGRESASAAPSSIARARAWGRGIGYLGGGYPLNGGAVRKNRGSGYPQHVLVWWVTFIGRSAVYELEDAMSCGFAQDKLRRGGPLLGV